MVCVAVILQSSISDIDCFDYVRDVWFEWLLYSHALLHSLSSTLQYLCEWMHACECVGVGHSCCEVTWPTSWWGRRPLRMWPIFHILYLILCLCIIQYCVPVSSTYTMYWALMLIGRRRVVLIRSLLSCSCLVWFVILCTILSYCVLFSSLLFRSAVFYSVLFCSALSRVVSCCTDSYCIVSEFYCSILYAILRNAPLWCVCYTAQCILHSFPRLLCSEALPYCGVLVYPLKYNNIHQICVRA